MVREYTNRQRTCCSSFPAPTERRGPRPPRFDAPRGTLPAGTITSRAKSWIDRINSAARPTYAAECLYSGDHHGMWSARSPKFSSKNSVGSKILVCSAGYGADLGFGEVPARIRQPSPRTIRTRSFRPQTNSGKAVVARQQWWLAVASWEGPQPGSARSLAGSDGSRLRVLRSSHFRRPTWTRSVTT